MSRRVSPDIAVLHPLYISYRNIQCLGEIHTHPKPTYGYPWNDILPDLSISLHTLGEYCNVEVSRNDLCVPLRHPHPALCFSHLQTTLSTWGKLSLYFLLTSAENTFFFQLVVVGSSNMPTTLVHFTFFMELAYCQGST